MTIPDVLSDALVKGLVEFGGWLVSAGLIAGAGAIATFAVRLWRSPGKLKRLKAEVERHEEELARVAQVVDEQAEANARLSRGFVVLAERHRRALDAERHFMYALRTRPQPQELAEIQSAIDDMRDDLYRAAGNQSHRPKAGPLLPGHRELRRVLTGEE